MPSSSIFHPSAPSERESERWFHQLAENIDAVFWIRELDRSRYLYISPAFERLWGRSCASLYEHPDSLIDTIFPDDRRKLLAAWEELEDGYPVELEHRIHLPDRSIRWIRARLFPIKSMDGEVYRVAGIASDITDRKLAEKALVEVSSRVRARIGQDLHDGLGQHLTGAMLMAKGLQKKLEAQGHAEAPLAAQLVHWMSEAIAQGRILAQGLYPVGLQSNGLVWTLRQLAEKNERLFKIRCRVSAKIEKLVRQPEAAIHLYRIAQEAVTNAAIHGKAKNIRIQLVREKNFLTLSIEDDGIGMPQMRPNPESMGLRIMHYRASIIGADFKVGPGDKGGTAVTCRLPITARS